MEVKYFAMIDGEQRGPYSLSELVEARVTPDTYVWRKGMPDWEPARSQGDICRYFRQRLAAINHPESIPSPARQPEQPQSEERADEPQQISRFSRWTDGERLPDPAEIGNEYSDSVPPATWLGAAVAATILCCPITGIVAIVYAAQSRRAWKEGRHKEAYDRARSAKMWVGISICFALIMYAVIFRNLA